MFGCTSYREAKVDDVVRHRSHRPSRVPLKFLVADSVMAIPEAEVVSFWDHLCGVHHEIVPTGIPRMIIDVESPEIRDTRQNHL